MPRPSRRDEVRATAARIFREQGYLAATMDLIADEVGLNKGTLYHYYPSKSAILNELLSEQVDATLELLARVPLTGSGLDRMRFFVREQVALVATKHDELVVFFQEVPWIDQRLPEEQARSIRQRIYRYEEFVKSLLAEGTRTGEFRPLSPSTILYSIIGLLAYLPSWYRRPASTSTDTRLVDEVTEFVINGIRAFEPPAATSAAPARSGKANTAAAAPPASRRQRVNG
ncbi:TetR/AcrR family transcriptional regulator [Dactylosporangium sp. AC04546]|uniref:TetR/AcrR family transcriptional regulator n=1 Tax=Dactylosporangium sp. AC04546 TaxID=2862460 RepID=UPI001EDFDDC0|nr:TetR/AcrR family transcriptional regulator [Dactylosporangium sp. AC04546]WVK87275.1 TetR/AcrR family transcriptional regulator [Dactylosporangium sp. AC04546]